MTGWADEFAARGLGPGDRVAICAGNSPAYAALLRACARGGPGLVLLPAKRPDAQLRALLASAGTVAAVFADGSRELGRATVVLPDLREAGEVAGDDAHPRWIAFTSGSGGDPRPVPLLRRHLAAAAAASIAHFGLDAGSRWLCCLPLAHVGGAGIVLRGERCGAGVDLLPGFDAAAVHECLETGGVRGISLVPTMLARLLDHRGDRPWPGSLRWILCGGAALPVALRRACARLGVPALASYGMTETVGHVAAQTPEDAVDDPADCGRPLPGVELRTGADGRLALRAAQCVADGEWFTTPDLGEQRDGRLRVHGRDDRTIVSGGEKVAPEAVEAVLRTHPQIRDAAVVGLADPEWGERVAACLVGDPGEGFDAWLREHLAPAQRPKSWRVLAELPTAGPGKVDLRAVADLMRSRILPQPPQRSEEARETG